MDGGWCNGGGGDGNGYGDVDSDADADGGNHLAAATQKRIMDAGVDLAMQQLHSHPVDIFPSTRNLHKILSKEFLWEEFLRLEEMFWC